MSEIFTDYDFKKMHDDKLEIKCFNLTSRTKFAMSFEKYFKIILVNATFEKFHFLHKIT